MPDKGATQQNDGGKYYKVEKDGQMIVSSLKETSDGVIHLRVDVNKASNPDSTDNYQSVAVRAGGIITVEIGKHFGEDINDVPQGAHSFQDAALAKAISTAYEQFKKHAVTIGEGPEALEIQQFIGTQIKNAGFKEEPIGKFK